jgi:hypothetical protein
MLTEQRLWLPPAANVDEGYARQVLKANDGQWVRLNAVTHRIAWPQDIAAGMKLDDPRFYESRELITIDSQGKAVRSPEPTPLAGPVSPMAPEAPAQTLHEQVPLVPQAAPAMETRGETP